jgi:hypothetical protein
LPPAAILTAISAIYASAMLRALDDQRPLGAFSRLNYRASPDR